MDHQSDDRILGPESLPISRPSYTVTVASMRELSNQYAKSSGVGGRMTLALFAFVAAGVILTFIAARIDSTTAVTIAVLAAILFLLQFVIYRSVWPGRQPEADFVRLPDESQTYTFDKDGVRIRNAISETQVPWSLVHRLGKVREYWLFQYLDSIHALHESKIDKGLEALFDEKIRLRQKEKFEKTGSIRKPLNLSWLSIVPIFGLVLFSLWLNEPKQSVGGKAAISKGEPKVFPLRAMPGDTIDLRVELNSGEPIDVWMTGGDGQREVVAFRSPMIAQNIDSSNYEVRIKWPYQGATVTIASHGRSDVKIAATVR